MDGAAEVSSSGNKLPRTRPGLLFVRALRPALYGLLVASAMLAFFAGGELAGHKLPGWVASAAPVLFGIFLVAFAIYRLALVRARKYPAANGLFQIGLGALVFVLLLPGSRKGFESSAIPSGPDDVLRLSTAPDPRVRALSAEVIGLRVGGTRWAAVLLERLSDDDAHVREAARAALSRLAGFDAAAGAPDDQVVLRWREEASRRGWLAQ